LDGNVGWGKGVLSPHQLVISHPGEVVTGSAEDVGAHTPERDGVGLTWLSVLPPQCSDVHPELDRKGVRGLDPEVHLLLGLGSISNGRFGVVVTELSGIRETLPPYELSLHLFFVHFTF
jgi:hypothetical protein